MENLDFNLLNSTCLKILNQDIDKKQKETLAFIGLFFINTKKKGLSNLKLIIPYYPNYKFIKLTIEYLTNLSSLIEILNFQKLDDFENTFLFDFFNYNRSNPKLFFEKRKLNIIKWEQNTFTTINEFLPVFSDKNLNQRETFKIHRFLNLFKEVRKNHLVNYPVKIDLEHKTLLLISKNHNNDIRVTPNFELIEFSKTQEEDITDEQYDLIESNPSLKKQIIIRYPRYRNIDYEIATLIDSTFEIEFRKRFFIEFKKEIAEKEIYILPKEMIGLHSINQKVINPMPFFKIIKTGHQREMYELYKAIRNEWKINNFNVYTHPFPKYFFTFINSSLNQEKWMEIFDIAFPKISETGIHRDVEQLIQHLINLDWVSRLKGIENLNFVFPDLTDGRFRSKRLRKAYRIFKSHCRLLLDKPTFSNEVDYQKQNVILNAFDTIEVINKVQCFSKNIQFILPDFSFFNYNPFVPLHAYDIQCNAFLEGGRQEFLTNYKEKEDKIKRIRQTIKDEIVQKLRRYWRMMKEEEEEEIADEKDFAEEEDNEKDSDEEIILEVESKKDSYKKVWCILSDGTKKEYSTNSFVYLKRQNFLHLKARNIKVGDSLLLLDRFGKKLTNEEFFNWLETVPDSVKYFRYQLGKIGSVFKKLKADGLRIDTEYYFNNTYLSDEESFDASNFKLPRRHDWKVICEFLDISDNDMNIAYIARYREKTQLKKVYKNVIKFLVDNDYLADIDNPELIEEITPLFNEIEALLKKKDSSFDLKDFIETILSSVSSQLDHYLEEVINVSIESKTK